MMSVLLLITIALITTVLAGGIAASRYRGGAAVTAGGTLIALFLATSWLYETYVRGITHIESIGMLTFVIDRITSLFVFTSLLIGFASALFALDISPRRNAATLPPFLSAFIFTVALLALSGNLITACVMVELQTFAIILTLLAGEEFASEAAVKYMYMTLLGTVFIMFGIGILFEIIPAPIVLGLALFGVGLLLKAGIFPFHAWLPDVHARAHTSASAVLSSVAVASGLIAFINIIKTYINVVPTAHLKTLGDALLAYALASVLYGSLCAITQPDIKRALAYSTIGHMGYALIPIALALALTKFELVSIAVLYVMVHALGKALLFLAGGLPVGLYGVHEYTHLGGLFRKHKVATWTFLGGALTLSGLPPLPGFFAKLLVILTLVHATLMTGSMYYGAMLALAVGVAVATPVYSIRRLWHRTFLGEAKETYPETGPTFFANAACILLLIALIVLGALPLLVPGPAQVVLLPS